MRKTKLTVKPTTAFKKDYKLAIKCGLQIELLETVVETNERLNFRNDCINSGDQLVWR